MVDILVRDVDDLTAKRLKDRAAAKGASLSETAREALTAYVKPGKGAAWAEVDAIRKKIGRVRRDSTADIRKDRDRR
jgi:plasmid stability protein